MTAEELSKQVGISNAGHYLNDSYVIELSNSDEFLSAYSICDSSDILEPEYESFVVSENSNLMNYITDDFRINLQADFSTNNYKVVITERRD